jgi:chromosome partitioning protein
VRVLALFHVKGGVGKTASAVNLACGAARRGSPTLLWDLDPQGSATFQLRVRPEVPGGGRALLRGDTEPDELVRESDVPGLHVLPSDASYRRLDELLLAGDLPADQVRRVVERLAGRFEQVFLDCAPHLSALSESVFESSDLLLAPTVPTTLSLRTLAQLLKHLKKRAGRRPRVLPFLCMIDRRKSLHREIAAFVRREDLGFLDAEIPYASVVERMAVERNPLQVFAPASPAAQAYESLWSEVLAKTAGEESPAVFERATREALERAALAALVPGGTRGARA